MRTGSLPASLPEKELTYPSPGTACHADTAPARRGCLRLNYFAGVERAGGAPLLLPNSEDPDNARASAGVADGLLLTGGWDINPRLYGQDQDPTVTTIDDVRDGTEMAAIEVAMARRIPIFAICRGIQILNVAMGGSLVQDIPTWAKRLPEDQRLGHSGTQHEIRIGPGSLLADLWGPQATVNSRHHQCVDRVATGLKVTAVASDGVIEAAESSDGYPLLALQCHPEDLWQKDPLYLRPFEWFIERARKRQ